MLPMSSQEQQPEFDRCSVYFHICYIYRSCKVFLSSELLSYHYSWECNWSIKTTTEATALQRVRGGHLAFLRSCTSSMFCPYFQECAPLLFMILLIIWDSDNILNRQVWMLKLTELVTFWSVYDADRHGPNAYLCCVGEIIFVSHSLVWLSALSVDEF